MSGTALDERTDRELVRRRAVGPREGHAAAADYLKNLNQMFGGDWYLTLASYNGGMGRVQRAIERSRHLRLLGTQRHVKVSAARHPRVRPDDPCGDHHRAQSHALRVRRHARRSDHLRHGHRAGRDRPAADCRVDRVDDRRHPPAQPRAAAEDDADRQARHQGAAGTGAALQQKLASADPSEFTTFQRYVVHRGDTVSRIASRFSLSTADLMAANELHSTRLHAGASLLIPSHPSARMTSHASAATATHASPGTPVVYAVRPGDTLDGIARASTRRSTKSSTGTASPPTTSASATN